MCEYHGHVFLFGVQIYMFALLSHPMSMVLGDSGLSCYPHMGFRNYSPDTHADVAILSFMLLPLCFLLSLNFGR